MTDDASSTGTLLGYIVKFRDGVKEPPAAQLYFEDTETGRAKAEAFARQHDEKGFSIYSCIGRLRGAPRNKANVAELGNLVLDLDLRNIVEGREEVIACLRALPLPPEIRDSGRGLHAIWSLKEPLIDAAGMAEAEATMRQLVTLLAGDPKPTHRAALLRHLGTHNSRDDAWNECHILEHGKPCDISEFADLFDLYGDTALLHYKEEAAAPFDSEGKRLPIDLEAMRYGKNMHDTFLGYLGSRLSYGDTVADIIERVVEAAERNCTDDPDRQKWRHNLADKATWWLEKHEEWIDTALIADHAQSWQNAHEQNRRPRIVWVDGRGLQVRTFSNASQSKSEDTKPAGQQQAPKVRFKLVQFCNLRPGMDEQPYLIDELIPAAGLVDVWGSHGYKKRVAALRHYYRLADDDPAPLYIISGNANLVADMGVIIRDIQTQLGNVTPVAVVLDTLNKSLHGSESKDVDMGNYIKAAEAIRNAFGCVVIIVHHCGLDETRPRGHTSLPGAVDAQLAVTRDGDFVTMEVEHMRDGPEGTIVTGMAKVIEVGVDGNGKVMTSLVIVPTDSPTVGARKKAEWPPSLRVFRDALAEAILSFPEDYQIEGGLKVHATDLERVREAFYKIYIVRGDKDQTKGQRQDTRKKAFNRCAEKAQAAHLMGARVLPDERRLVWLAVTEQGYYGES
jgi:hypothetical protein